MQIQCICRNNYNKHFTFTKNKELMKQQIYLERYKKKTKLGKGAYGDVYLVEDIQNGKDLYALKLISRKKIEAEGEHIVEYLEGEIECMKNMDYPHVIKLYDSVVDDQYYYLLLEYCEGGDLVNRQALLPERVYTLPVATQMLSQVILGLEYVHNQGYLHRDIKPQNVLIKKQGNAQILKLADFGFTKKKAHTYGTVLGTEMFMSPEIFACGKEDIEQTDLYGFEVDMWAFGVLFYYMLNLEYPFQIGSPYWTPQLKEQHIRKQAKNFSYKSSVLKGNKRILANCTEEMEDLFKKIFDLRPLQRITFSQIRQHEVFRKHFPNISVASVHLYQSKFKSKILKKKQGEFKQTTSKLKEALSSLRESNYKAIVPTMTESNSIFFNEKQSIAELKDQFQFLILIIEEFQTSERKLESQYNSMFLYNLIKYQIILLRQFLGDQFNAKALNTRYPGLQWNKFCDSPTYANIEEQVKNQLVKLEMKFQLIYNQCKDKLPEIQKINSKFQNAFSKDIKQTQTFSGAFKESYRKGTSTLYSAYLPILKQSKSLQLLFLTCLIVIAHVFNALSEKKQLKKLVFGEFAKNIGLEVEKIYFSELKSNLEKANKEELSNIIKNIITNCFND